MCTAMRELVSVCIHCVYTFAGVTVRLCLCGSVGGHRMCLASDEPVDFHVGAQHM